VLIKEIPKQFFWPTLVKSSQVAFIGYQQCQSVAPVLKVKTKVLTVRNTAIHRSLYKYSIHNNTYSVCRQVL